MKKTNIIILILSILLLPFQGSAKDECDSNKIEIKSIELVDKTLVAEELSKPEIDNMSIKTDVSLSKPGDEVNYEIKVENKSSSDYELKDEDLKSDSEFINYSITYEDNDNIIKGNSEKNVYLRISYAKEVPKEQLQDGKFQDNQTINIAGVTKKNRQSILVNPATGTIFSLILVIVICLSYLIVSKKQKKKSILLLIALLAIPTVVKAVCSFSLDVDSKVTIDTRSTTFKTGDEVNIQMKKLANPEVNPTSITTSYQDNNILYFKKSDNLPTGLTEENIVSTSDSETPIYMWFDTDTIYYYTEAKLIYLNENASGMFRNLRKVLTVEGLNRVDASKTTNLNSFFTWCIELLSIDPLENWDTSNVTDIHNMFTNCRNIPNVDGLTNWNVSNVQNMKSIFARCWKLENVDGLKNWDISKIVSLNQVFFENKGLSDISGLSNWNVSNVEDLSNVFVSCESIKDLSPLSNWNVSKAINKLSMFSKCKMIEDLSPLSNWDMSKTVNMKSMFYDCSSLKNINAISNWDVSNVKDISGLFFGCSGLVDVNGINGWDVSSVEDMSGMFDLCVSLKNLDAFKNWDVSNVTNMSNMFGRIEGLEDASGINDWDISAVTNFNGMFNLNGSLNPNHPDFSKRPGTWNDKGTFIPNN